MGMFDTVNFVCACPKCGFVVSGFQSKDGECNLEMIEPEAVGRFYSSCPHCKEWIEFSRDRPSYPQRKEPLTLEQVEALGFVMQHHTPDYIFRMQETEGK